MIKVRFDLECDQCQAVGFVAPKAKDQVELLALARDHGWGYRAGQKPSWTCPLCTRGLKTKGERFTFDNDQYELGEG